jgi:hypothetical protein
MKFFLATQGKAIERGGAESIVSKLNQKKYPY